MHMGTNQRQTSEEKMEKGEGRTEKKMLHPHCDDFGFNDLTI
jgi:hypothetical protein